MEPKTDYHLAILTKLGQLARQADLDTTLLDSSLLLFKCDRRLQPVVNSLSTYAEQLGRGSLNGHVTTIRELVKFARDVFQRPDECLSEAWGAMQDCDSFIQERRQLPDPW